MNEERREASTMARAKELARCVVIPVIRAENVIPVVIQSFPLWKMTIINQLLLTIIGLTGYYNQLLTSYGQ